MQSSSPVLIAKILSAHGIKGQVKIKIFASSATTFASYGQFISKDARQTFKLESFYSLKEDLIVGSFFGFNDRNRAESFSGVELYVLREQLSPLEQEEYYYQDLIGLHVMSEKGIHLGVVVSVYNFGSGDLIELRLEDSSESIVLPFTKEAVPKVLISEKHLIVNFDFVKQLTNQKGSKQSI